MTVRSPSELVRHWQTVAGAMIGGAFGPTGIVFYTFGVFVKPLTEEFSWSRAQVSAGTLFLHGGTVIAGPFIGSVTDRFGPRTVGLIALVGMAIGLVGLSSIGGNVAYLYAAWLVLALLGVGATPIVWTRAVNRCFDRQRGFALGLTLSGTGIAAVVAPHLLGQVIAGSGWRAAYLTLAGVTVLIALPLVAFFLRERVSSRTGTPMPAADALPLEGATLREALATEWYWRSAFSFFLVAGGIGALIVHIPPMLMDAGRSAAEAGKIAGLLGFAVIVARLLVGYLVDRLPAAYVGMAFLLLPPIGCVLLTRGQAVPAVLLIGLAAGAEVDLLAYLVSRRFGLRHYGRIYGLQLSSFMLAAGIAPMAMGAAQDHWGSYQIGLLINAAVIAVGAIGIGSLKHGGEPRARLAVAS